MGIPAVGGVYIIGGGVVGEAIWLMTPEGQRAGQSFSEAVAGGTSSAYDQVSSLFRSKDEENEDTRTVPTTNDAVKRCDGMHRGRLQVQGYRRPEPVDFDALVPMVSWAWDRPCPPPRAEGLAQLSSNLLIQTQNISQVGAGIRAGCFVKMSKHIKSSPSIGFVAPHSIGWGVTPSGMTVRNRSAGQAGPRVDLEVHLGRAFGDS